MPLCPTVFFFSQLETTDSYGTCWIVDFIRRSRKIKLQARTRAYRLNFVSKHCHYETFQLVFSLPPPSPLPSSLLLADDEPVFALIVISWLARKPFRGARPSKQGVNEQSGPFDNISPFTVSRSFSYPLPLRPERIHRKELSSAV